LLSSVDAKISYAVNDVRINVGKVLPLLFQSFPVDFKLQGNTNQKFFSQYRLQEIGFLLEQYLSCSSATLTI